METIRAIMGLGLILFVAYAAVQCSQGQKAYMDHTGFSSESLRRSVPEY